LALAKLLQNNQTLAVLCIHWNYIRGKGSMELANALATNDTLQVFDASFNSFGSCEDNISSKAWRNLFLTNKKLLHLDLSHNAFKVTDCKILGISRYHQCQRRD
jgi:hypothetical protein